MARGRQSTPPGRLKFARPPIAPGSPWPRPRRPRRIAVPSIEPHRVYHVALTGLEPGKKFGLSDQQGNQGRLRGRGPRSPVGRPEAAVRRVRRLRSQHARTEGDRLPGVCLEAPLRDDHRRHRLRQGSDLRISHQLLADLTTRTRRRPRKVPPCSARPSSSPLPAITTSPRATWGRLRTAWRTSTTGSSR